MKIEIVDGYKMLSDVSRKSTLIIESNRLEDCLRFAAAKKVTKIYLQYNYGFKLSNVDFLKNYDFFTEVSIIKDLQDIDISGVQFLKRLIRLTLSNGNQGLDFGNFPLLEEASVHWNSKLKNLELCKSLQKLTLWQYKPKSGSCQELGGLSSLISLKITQSNIRSLTGLEGLKHLQEFEGYYLTKLEDIAKIITVSNTLRFLTLDHCKKLHAYEKDLASLANLQKLILGDCGDLDSLKFVRHLTKLIFLSFVGTNIKDGNLSFLLGRKFEHIGFDDKRHYSHKMKELNPEFS
jgi:protein phosphatase 1 regulatory subunit 7